jgi:hypothetical protein
VCQRGSLGIISNVITSKEIPDWMEAEDLNKYLRQSCYLPLAPADPEICRGQPEDQGHKKNAFMWNNPKGTLPAPGILVCMIILLMDPQFTGSPLGENKPDLVIHHSGNY